LSKKENFNNYNIQHLYIMSTSFESVTKSINSVRNTVYVPGDIIEIDVPVTDVSVINPRGTKMKFHVKIADGANVCAQPDGLAGAWALIKTIQIFDLNTNTLLEQIDEAHHLVSLMKHYSKTPSIENSWELLHGQCPNNRPNSLYYDQVGALGVVVNNAVEVVMSIQVSGLLKESAALFPNLLIGGLRIRITLEDAALSLSTYPCARVVNQAPIPGLNQYPQGCGGGLEGAALAADSVLPPVLSSFGVQTGFAAGGAVTTLDVNSNVTITGPLIKFDPTVDCQFKIGQRICVRDTSAGAAAITVLTEPITNVTVLGAVVTLIFGATAFPSPVVAADNVWISAASLTASYEVSNFELLVSSADYSATQMSSMMKSTQSDAGMNLDYKSWNIYRDNMQAKTSNPQVTLDCTEFRALSLVQMPYNPTATIGQERSPMRTINDEGLNYSYNIANRNTPSRPVPINRVSSNIPLAFDAIHGLELEKAVERCDVASRFMCNNNAFFAIGRSLSRKHHSFDANNNNIRLAVLYSTATTANVVNKVLESQMYHIRRLNISNGTIRVDF
jgi:hypothetical protein